MSLKFNKKVKISGKLVFETAFHIGSGVEGELTADKGILKEADGRPILPGSTLKGSFRHFAEKLAPHLGFTACQLDTSLSGVSCISDREYRKTHLDEFRAIVPPEEKIKWLAAHTCDVCRLMGSPLHISRLFFCDGQLINWNRKLHIRQGFSIDRDSETVIPHSNYNYEATPRGARFQIHIEMMNPEDIDLAIAAATFGEWQNGFRLGGYTSRGLGKCILTEMTVDQVDYTNSEQLSAYLLSNEMVRVDSLLTGALKRFLEIRGGSDA